MQDLALPDSPPLRVSGKHARNWREYQWGAATPMILVHLGALGAIWSGVTWTAVVVGIVLYWARMFGVTAGYHRYFSHRTYKTSRPMQFLLAVLAQSSAQRGVLWWAAHHRDHHRYSDDERDVHSPVKFGFWHAHIGWVYDHNDKTKSARVKDLAKYPELLWLDKHWLVPPMVLGFSTYFLFGWSGLFIGFFLSTALLWHCTFTINSLAHLWGKRRYETTDDSRNNWFLAFITMGEGWHNNHHHYMASCRQGFYWWELDMSYYIVKAMGRLGLVWDIREPPRKVYAPAQTKTKTKTKREPEALPKAA
jgi:stearoyl-CoA desaturase (delta-9 desaturase)